MSEPPLDRHRLAVLRHVEEVTGNAAMTCRYFGITRQTYYNWLRRYEAEGVDGLRDRSRRPRTSPNATRAEVVEKILHLRTAYHFGPDKIVMYLKRYHDVFGYAMTESGSKKADRASSDRMMSVAQIAMACGISKMTVYRADQSGEVSATRVGRNLRILRSDARSFFGDQIT